MKNKIILWMMCIVVMMLMGSCTKDTKLPEGATGETKLSQTQAQTTKESAAGISDIEITEAETSGLNLPDIDISKLNPAFLEAVQKAKMEPLGIVVDMPDKDFIAQIKQLDIYEQDDSLESFVVIPMYNGTNVKLITLAYEEDTLTSKEVVYENQASEGGYGLWVKAIRPEGAPNLKVTLEYEGKTADYMITYYGKDGIPKCEYIFGEVSIHKSD